MDHYCVSKLGLLNGHHSCLPALITPLSKEQRCWFDLKNVHALCKMANLGCNSGCEFFFPRTQGCLCSVLALCMIVPHP